MGFQLFSKGRVMAARVYHIKAISAPLRIRNVPRPLMLAILSGSFTAAVARRWFWAPIFGCAKQLGKIGPRSFCWRLKPPLMCGTRATGGKASECPVRHGTSLGLHGFIGDIGQLNEVNNCDPLIAVRQWQTSWSFLTAMSELPGKFWEFV